MIKKFYGKKGITLVSLVITIVIMLILAGVSISFILGNNGLISKVTSSKETYNLSSAKEKLNLVITEYSTECAENFKDEEVLDFGNFLLNNYEDNIGIVGIDDDTYNSPETDLTSYESINDLIVNMKEYSAYNFKVEKQNGGIVIVDSMKNTNNLNEEPKGTTIILSGNNNSDNKEITATVNLIDETYDIDVINSKWKFNTSSAKLGTDQNNYDFSFKDTNEVISLIANTKINTRYYLHVLTVNSNGDKVETISKPVTINNLNLTTAEQLKQLALNTHKGYDYEGLTINLKNDVNLSTVCSESKGSWPIIGIKSQPFHGIFDGENKIVSNLYYNDMSVIDINDFNLVNVGFFGSVEAGGIVKNITVNNANIKAKTATTNLALCMGSVIANVGEGGFADNCVVTGDISLYSYNTGTQSPTSNVVGGCIGMASNTGIVVNSGANLNSGILHAEYSYCTKMGSFIGSIVDSKVYNCYAINPNGNVTQSAASAGRIGNFTGGIEVGTAGVYNSYYLGNETYPFSAYTYSGVVTNVYNNPSVDGLQDELNNWVNTNQVDTSAGYTYHQWETVNGKVVTKR